MNLEPLFSKEQIQQRVFEIGQEINQTYGSSEIVAIGILKGAFIFYSDLLKHLEQSIICDFCSLSFYGSTKKASSSAILSLDVKTPLKAKQVLLIDCIADYGHSLSFIKNLLEQREPHSIKTACLIVKPYAIQNTQIDFKGFEVGQDNFVVGYGIDYNNQARNLDYLAKLKDLN